MRKNSRLTVKPLNAWNFSKFKTHLAQVDEYEATRHIFRNGYPPHQAMIYDGRKSICACGLIDMGGGQFYIWTLFGKDFKKIHYRFAVRYFNNYLNMLEFSSVHHIIRKSMPWTRHMISLAGFRYVRDEDDFTEHWVRI